MNSETVSYHLRQLAVYGFIEDDLERGTKRDRWWRAAHESTAVPSIGRQEPPDAEDRQARQAYTHAVVLGYLARLHGSLLERSELPHEWASTTDDSDWTMWLTPREARALLDRVHAMLRDAAEAAPRDRDHAPEGSEQYTIHLHGFPRPGRLVPGSS